MFENDRTKNDWILTSLIIVLITLLLTWFFYEKFWALIPIMIILLLWLFIAIYIFANLIRERTQFAFRVYLSKITGRKFYTTPFFLLILGFVFFLVVVGINMICGQVWAGVGAGILFGPYGYMIINLYQKIILDEWKKIRKKRNKSSFSYF